MINFLKNSKKLFDQFCQSIVEETTSQYSTKSPSNGEEIIMTDIEEIRTSNTEDGD
jgi:hypothetical protein